MQEKIQLLIIWPSSVSSSAVMEMRKCALTSSVILQQSSGGFLVSWELQHDINHLFLRKYGTIEKVLKSFSGRFYEFEKNKINLFENFGYWFYVWYLVSSIPYCMLSWVHFISYTTQLNTVQSSFLTNPSYRFFAWNQWIEMEDERFDGMFLNVAQQSQVHMSIPHDFVVLRIVL